jgi:hypothetical protein
MKILSRLNFAVAFFALTMLALFQCYAMVALNKIDGQWDVIKTASWLALFSFIFIRFALLYIREGEESEPIADDAPSEQVKADT